MYNNTHTKMMMIVASGETCIYNTGGDIHIVWLAGLHGCCARSTGGNEERTSA